MTAVAVPSGLPRDPYEVHPVPSRSDTSELLLHGERVTYRACGDEGPLIVLLHGVTGSSQTWDRVLPLLGPHTRVIAPDLLGHGESAKPENGDYSLGAWASGVRDLLVALGHQSATIVGHSLGGGVALQFAYQFPERCERLVLVGSGGLGREVHTLLRAVALPGAEHVLPLLVSPWVRRAGDGVLDLLGRVNLQLATDHRESWAGMGTLTDPAARRAFVSTVRAVIGVAGQRVSAIERLYLAEEMPTLLLWGADDSVIPAHHGASTHERLPGSRLEIIEGAGHFPHRDRPGVFAHHLLDFLASTEPADIDVDRWQSLLRRS
jgi:pimeloyl-ACP methyl ester carboxylesterase